MRRVLPIIRCEEQSRVVQWNGKAKAVHRRRVAAVVFAANSLRRASTLILTVLWVCVCPTEEYGMVRENSSRSRLCGPGLTRVREPKFARDKSNLFWGDCVPQRLALRGGRSTTLPTMLYRFLEENQTIGTRRTAKL